MPGDVCEQAGGDGGRTVVRHRCVLLGRALSPPPGNRMCTRHVRPFTPPRDRVRAGLARDVRPTLPATASAIPHRPLLLPPRTATLGFV